MIAPLQPYALAGVLRYQGESDAAAAPNTSGSGVSNLDLAAAQKLRRKIRRQVDTRYSLLSANSSTSSRPLNLNLNALRIPQGARIVVEEVSAASHGEVHAVLDLPASGTISLTQPAE